jgi:hypothetical protein
MEANRYVVMKLVSGEEILGHLTSEDDYDIRVLFPMIVKHVNRNIQGRLMESIVLGPWTHFSAEDEFTFNKQHLIFLKDLDERYIDEYNRSVDESLGNIPDPEPYNPEELKQLTDKLSNLFRDRLKEDLEEDLEPKIVLDISKTIH